MLAAVIAAGWAAPAVAQVRVTEAGCGGLDSEELAVLTGLELHSVRSGRDVTRPLFVALECQGDLLRIRIVDPALLPLARIYERQWTASPPHDPGRLRDLALLIAEQFLGLWQQQPGAAQDRAPVTPPVIQAAPIAAAAPPRPAWSLGLYGLAAARDLAHPALSRGIELRGGVGDRRALVVALGWNRTEAARTRGTVDADLVTAAAGAAAATARTAGGFSLGAHALLFGAFVRMSGTAAAASVAGTSTHGFGGGARLGAGPRLGWGRMRLALEVEAGYLAPSFVGRVSGESDVSVGGPWVGGALGVEID